ncbi:hypothetical protein [Sphingomonas sp. R1]|uniref:hypothetical protein n=1 Tax=Sphingomonas sp. R1 TaxID=399176 RepID=UPI0022250367|nr:hypothetical protein [Sphingomonas sp. R1]UYY77479.1 hypothetical protein OIM94_00250 [Sphingomonas sp. R1]
MKPLKTTRRIREVATIMSVCAELAVDKDQFLARFRQFRALTARYAGPTSDVDPYVEQVAKALVRYLERIQEDGFSDHVVTGGDR